MSETTPSRNEEIAGILRDEILRGQYRAGERLPSERELAVRFQTSRGTVREALKTLEQLGLAAIQPGGARAVSIEHCTLDVLGPLLDLNEVPDAVLVDQVLEIFGELLCVATRAAVRDASAAQIAEADRVVKRIIETAGGSGQHEALRALAALFVDVSGHLVLRLIVNGLSTQFMARMHARGSPPALEASRLRGAAEDLRQALAARDADGAERAIRMISRLIRDGAHEALAHDKSRERKAG
jgi:GntR family transcriptional regulator, transcriptional repressor for pyruvate dehydrogenase complex